MIRLAAPEPLHGTALAEQIRAAVGVPVTVTLIGSEIEVVAEDDAPLDRAQVAQVVAAHVPPPPPTDPDDELIAAITAATTLAQLKDALVGKGRTAVVAGRDKNR